MNPNNELLETIKVPAGAISTPFEAENTGLLHSLTWLQDKNWQRVIMFMDSQAVLKTLESKHSVSDRTTVKIQSLLTDAKGEIILQWIPAHHDIAGNKLADAAAKTACQMDQSGV